MGVTGSRPAGWRKRAPQLLAGIGSILVLAVTFLPWYRVGTSHLPRAFRSPGDAHLAAHVPEQRMLDSDPEPAADGPGALLRTAQ